MNFLGHIFLSGEEKEILLGNFITDHVKGKQQHEYSPGVMKGIQLHRSIDHYTDHHPIVLQGVKRLNGDYGRYASVIIDMYYDHFLSLHWNQYHPEPIIPYTERIYATLLSYAEILPARTQHMLSYMIRDNWLASYAQMEGLEKALGGMSRRARFESGMESAAAFLLNHYETYRDEFSQFMPEMIKHAEQTRDNLNSNQISTAY